MKILVAIRSSTLLDSLLSTINEVEGVKSMGYVSSAEDAIGLINTLMFDLLIVEVLLRSGSGFGVLTHLRKKALNARFIMVTDAPYQEYRTRSLELGADYFFNIEQDFDAFKQRLKKISEEYSVGQADSGADPVA